jgi:hypothetical protein
MTTQEELKTFILSILDDDEGISEESWNRLTDFLQSIGEMELIGELAGLVKSCNGRRYIV